MTRWPLLLLLALACALAAAGCAGEDGEAGGGDVDAILADTFGEGKEVRSGRLDLGLRLNAKGLLDVDGPVSLRLSGPFASTGTGKLPRFDFDVALDASGQTLRAGAISTGDEGFLIFQDQAYAVSDELFARFERGYAEQARCAAEKKKSAGVSFRALGIDPRRWLTDAQEAGAEEVGGAATTHISAGVDVPRFLEDVNRVLGRTDLRQEDACAPRGRQPERRPARKLTEEQRTAIADAVKDARVDVWTGEEDRVLRRLAVALRFDVPDGQRAKLNGLSTGDVRFDLTFAALDEPQEIVAPANAKPLEDLLARFGGAAPGLGGGTGGDGAGASGGARGSGQSPRYLRCVERAGRDVRKLQACADLLNR